MKKKIDSIYKFKIFIEFIQDRLKPKISISLSENKNSISL